MPSALIPPGQPAIDADSQLVAALAADDPGPALEKAFSRLARGADLALAMAMVKALVREGLAGVAAGLVRALHAAAESDPNLEALAAQIERMPSGELPRATLQSRLTARRAALTALNPRLESIPPSLDSGLRAYRSRRGDLHLLRDNPAARLDLVFPFTDQRALAGGLRLPEATLTTSYLLIGVPGQAIWKALLHQATAAGYEPPIDLVEPDPAVFAAWLATLEDEAPLRTERVSCFVGPEASLQLRQWLAEHAWRTAPTHMLTNHRPGFAPPSVDGAFLAPAAEARAKRDAEAKRRMHARHEGKDLAFWRRRYREAGSTQPPLRFVGFTTRYSTVIQYAMADLAAAFRRRGCGFDLVMQPSKHCPTVDVVGALAGGDHDGIVVINHLRLEFGDTKPANIPYVCWMQDHMDALCDRKAGQSIGPLDLVITHSPHVYASLYGYPLGRCLPSSNLTDPATYSDEPLPEAELAPMRCDVAFAAHGSGTPEELADEITRGAPPAFRAMIETFLKLVRARLERDGWINSPELVMLMLEAESASRHPALSPLVRRSRIYPQLARIYDRVFRHEAIRWAASWAKKRGRSFRLYGQGWERNPEFAPYAAGQVAGGRPMRALYQATSVTLQMNGYSSLHQRLLDCLASGGFVLSRENPADSIRAPFLEIQRAIRELGLTSLAQLAAKRQTDAKLDEACRGAERLGGAVIRPVGDARRDAHVAAMRAGNDIDDLRTDAGLFEMLRDMRLIPTRVAADLPGFDQTVFGTEAALHELLDRFVDDPAARAAVAAPMRRSVIEHDTYDSLVDRIIGAFRGDESPEGGR